MTQETTISDLEARFAGSEVYLESAGRRPLSDHAEEFEVYLQRIRALRPIDENSRLLEVGVGTGWFLVMCAQRGLVCRGLEINPVNLRYAREYGRRHDVEVNVELGSIEDAALPERTYDAVVAMSVFEHVREWRRGLENVYHSLKPGGVLYFYSTNKWSPISGEYPHVPFYGWLPDRARYRLRIARQGESIMQSSGIDFNQFTYLGLEREFRRIGFSRSVDQYELLNISGLAKPAGWKRAVVRSYERVRPVKSLVRTFSTGTCLVCVR